MLFQLPQPLLVLLGGGCRQRQQQAAAAPQAVWQLQLERCRRLCRRRSLRRALLPCCDSIQAGGLCGLCGLGALCHGSIRRSRCRLGLWRGGYRSGSKIPRSQVQVHLLGDFPAGISVQQQQPLLLPRLRPSHCTAPCPRQSARR